MKIRIASLLFALALPLAAQEPVAAETEAMFYKAFYLEKGQRDFAGAMTLYEQFLAKAPEHKLASEAAKQQFNLLNATGKTKERDAFKAKYEKLLGNAASAPVAGAGGAAGGDAPRGDRPGAGAGGAGAGRPDMAARIAETEKALEKAKADGNAEEVKKLEQQLERMRQGGGRGQGGPGGAGAGGQGGARRGGLMGVMMGNKKIAEMTPEEVTQLKEGVATYTVSDRMKQNLTEEQVKKLEGGVADLKKALDANKTEDAQKALDALREVMPRGRGRGGEAGGGGGGGNRGGGGGNAGGGGGGGGNGGGGGGGGGR